MLEINHVTKHFGNKIALDNISLQLNPGKCIGLIGPNGAGKSTLIKIIVTIIESDSGIVQSSYSKREIGYVPQDTCLEEQLTALQNLYFFGELYHLKKSILQDRAEKILAFIGLTDRKKDKVSTFSGGMKRRLNIGCALMNNPKVIMMDEPTVGVDPQSRKHILDMIHQLKSKNHTIIYSTHYMEEAERICDEIVFIDRGIIIQHNHIDDILANYAKPEVYVSFKNLHIDIEGLLKSEGFKTYKKGFVYSEEKSTYALETILQMCKDHHLTLEKLELLQPRLEDIFFQLTGSELRS